MEHSFPITTASGSAFWVIIPTALLLLAVLGLMLYSVYSLYNLRVLVGEEAIEVKGDLYGRRIPLSRLRLDQARVVDLQRETDYALASRTNGIGLPGYNSGWFKLRNGEKALAFVTQTQRVALVPTKEGYTLLLSVEPAERFLETLKASSADRG